MHPHKNALIFLLMTVSCMTGCKKYLEEKPDKKLDVPTTIGQFQQLLNDPLNNRCYLGGLENSADDLYLLSNDWNGLSQSARNMYVWNEDFVFESSNNDWSNTYGRILPLNLVLDGLEKIDRTQDNSTEWDNTKGAALFLRAHYFSQMLWMFAPAYDPATASSDLGIPLRMSADFNIPSVRSSVQQCYERILADLKQSIPLLPVMPSKVVKPSVPAVYGLLARVYLYMRNYDSAFAYADKYQQLRNELLDYNTLNVASANPIANYNVEDIFDAFTLPAPVAVNRVRVDTSLYATYHPDDLRRSVFFRTDGPKLYGFKGSYSRSNWYCGIATDEIYLIRAECYARLGNKQSALDDLNTLLRKRWKNTVSYPEITAADLQEALNKILIERRKELLFRGIRFMDLKRFNKEGANMTLKRVLNGTEYLLHPNDLRYALPIPENVITITGMPQNPR